MKVWLIVGAGIAVVVALLVVTLILAARGVTI